MWHCFAGLGLCTSIERAVQAVGPVSKNFASLSTKMADYVLQSRSCSTVSKYYKSFQRWENFVLYENGCPLPAEPIHVALYVTNLLEKQCSHSVISSAVYSIKWVHGINGYSDPTKNCFVQNLIETSKRIARKPKMRKDCVSSDMVKELCELYKHSNDLLLVRDLAMIVIAFSGFLRFDELSSLRICDVSFHDSFLKLFIRKSKTDQYRMGNEVVISKGETHACPFLLLQKYLRLSNHSSSTDFLFKPVFRSKNSCKLVYKSKPLSYTRARECIVARLKEVSPTSNFGLHSLRSGGATAAANNNVNERCLKRHGRWRSDVSKDMYISDSLTHRLQVTKLLSL